ncbi:MAG: threonylcarbamoyl-AMP synthase [Candidatus Micrarchaeota archaeon]|nr:threonylcarbamoyl-AMP synthase [Candidatus Micrarchaeota archaeon]
MTKVIKVNPVNPEMELIREAAAIIKSGGIVAFPTETVYGLGADAFNGGACRNIFKAKNRPMDNPLIAHISKTRDIERVAREVPEEVMNAVKILWPGPVTFRLKKNEAVPIETTAGLDTISVRMPAHPVALRLIEASGTPIAAPSANISTRPSGTRAEHVIKDFDGKIDAILDGGDAAFGMESTIIDATVEPYLLLRPGAFTMEELRKYLDIEVPESINISRKDVVAVAPGMKYRHYAPDTKLIAVQKDLLESAVEHLGKRDDYAVLCSNETAERISDSRAKLIRMGSERSLYEIAKNLFDSFRELDKKEVKFALVETFPERGIGLAIMNRIIKASGSAPVSSIEGLKELV